MRVRVARPCADEWKSGLFGIKPAQNMPEYVVDKVVRPTRQGQKRCVPSHLLPSQSLFMPCHIRGQHAAVTDSDDCSCPGHRALVAARGQGVLSASVVCPPGVGERFEAVPPGVGRVPAHAGAAKRHTPDHQWVRAKNALGRGRTLLTTASHTASDSSSVRKVRGSSGCFFFGQPLSISSLIVGFCGVASP